MKLTIELVPSTCWMTNVRSQVSKESWDEIRREVYQAAHHRCQICGGRGDFHAVECHEIWRYDDEKRSQVLDGMLALCPACHQVKHIGLAQINGQGAAARDHLAKVNGLTVAQADAEIKKAFDTWAERSRHNWVLFLPFLDLRGIPYERKDGL